MGTLDPALVSPFYSRRHRPYSGACRGAFVIAAKWHGQELFWLDHSGLGWTWKISPWLGPVLTTLAGPKTRAPGLANDWPRIGQEPPSPGESCHSKGSQAFRLAGTGPGRAAPARRGHAVRAWGAANLDPRGLFAALKDPKPALGYPGPFRRRKRLFGVFLPPPRGARPPGWAGYVRYPLNPAQAGPYGPFLAIPGACHRGRPVPAEPGP